MVKVEKVDRYLSVRGGEMKVPPGRYSVVAYNYNTESIRIRGEESYETIEAYTGNCNGLGIAGTEKMVWSPDSLYVLNIDELKIDKSEEVLSFGLETGIGSEEVFFCGRGQRFGVRNNNRRVY